MEAGEAVVDAALAVALGSRLDAFAYAGRLDLKDLLSLPDVLDAATRHALRQSARYQVVSRVARLDLDDLSHAAEPVNILVEQDLQVEITVPVMSYVFGTICADTGGARPPWRS